jgi:hypothetical protein
MGHGRPLESPDNSSKRNPQFVTRSMGVVDTSPLCPEEGRQRGVQTSRRAHPIALNGPRLGGLTHYYTSWVCTERVRVSIRAHGTAEAG